ncbi:histidine-containing phosphotransfer protein 2-like [Corylus avellana]|uniref:histidine-containing phosphotransfer protein 2-like n=1 Tax=Corylus avellana TaxID=13451 RepID=UPI00286C158F|nr:histidine-containing phosphotransfer protein 2-like [Corylus avellana]
MDLHGLQTQHDNLIQSMFYEGMLDSQFAQIQVLQDASNPNFVMEVITIFCNDAERIMLELNNYLGQQDVDFNKLNGLVHQLKGSSSSIGAQHLKLACIDLQQASEDKNKERCQQALNIIAHKYCLLRSKFRTLIQLEKAISAFATNQQLLDSKYIDGSA